MKKQKIEISKKLFISKETISLLSTGAGNQIVGGANTQMVTCYESCAMSCSCPSAPENCVSIRLCDSIFLC